MSSQGETPIYIARKISKEDGQKLKGLFYKDREKIISLLREYETTEQSWQRAKTQLKVLKDSQVKEALSLLSNCPLESLNPDLENCQKVPLVSSSQSSLDHSITLSTVVV